MTPHDTAVAGDVGRAPSPPPSRGPTPQAPPTPQRPRGPIRPSPADLARANQAKASRQSAHAAAKLAKNLARQARQALGAGNATQARSLAQQATAAAQQARGHATRVQSLRTSPRRGMHGVSIGWDNVAIGYMPLSIGYTSLSIGDDDDGGGNLDPSAGYDWQSEAPAHAARQLPDVATFTGPDPQNPTSGIVLGTVNKRGQSFPTQFYSTGLHVAQLAQASDADATGAESDASSASTDAGTDPNAAQPAAPAQPSGGGDGGGGDGGGGGGGGGGDYTDDGDTSGLSIGEAAAQAGLHTSAHLVVSAPGGTRQVQIPLDVSITPLPNRGVRMTLDVQLASGALHVESTLPPGAIDRAAASLSALYQRAAAAGMSGDPFSSFLPMMQHAAASPIAQQAAHTLTHPADDPYVNLASSLYLGPLGPKLLRAGQDSTYAGIQQAQAQKQGAQVSGIDAPPQLVGAPAMMCCGVVLEHVPTMVHGLDQSCGKGWEVGILRPDKPAVAPSGIGAIPPMRQQQLSDHTPAIITATALLARAYVHAQRTRHRTPPADGRRSAGNAGARRARGSAPRRPDIARENSGSAEHPAGRASNRLRAPGARPSRPCSAICRTASRAPGGVVRAPAASSRVERAGNDRPCFARAFELGRVGQWAEFLSLDARRARAKSRCLDLTATGGGRDHWERHPSTRSAPARFLHPRAALPGDLCKQPERGNDRPARGPVHNHDAPL